MSHQHIARAVLARESIGLKALAAMLGADFDRCVDFLATVPGRIITTGVGKSGHVARKVASTLASTGTPAMYVHPVEASHGDMGMILPDDCVWAFSKSGHAVEIENMAAYCSSRQIAVVLTTENVCDGLSRHARYLLPIPALDEAWGKAPTVSTTLQMALGDAVAAALAEARGFRHADFLELHPGGAIGRAA